MFDLVLVYTDGTTEIAQYGLTEEEIDSVGQWYRTHAGNVQTAYGQATLTI